MTAAPFPLPMKIVLAAEALVALAHARLILHRTRPGDVLARNHAASSGAREQDDTARACAEVTFIIPRIAKRVPWRADCLVQALAAQAMLRRRKVASAIVVGTAKQPGGVFEAHAWLSCRGEIILGGDIARFEPLLESGNGPAGPS